MYLSRIWIVHVLSFPRHEQNKVSQLAPLPILHTLLTDMTQLAPAKRSFNGRARRIMMVFLGLVLLLFPIPDSSIYVEARGLQFHDYVLYPPHTLSRCPLGHSHIADQKDCHAFYHCRSSYWGVQMVKKTCGIYMLFNPITEICDWPYKVKAVRPECYYESMALGLWRPVQGPSKPLVPVTPRPSLWQLMDLAFDEPKKRKETPHSSALGQPSVQSGSSLATDTLEVVRSSMVPSRSPSASENAIMSPTPTRIGGIEASPSAQDPADLNGVEANPSSQVSTPSPVRHTMKTTVSGARVTNGNSTINPRPSTPEESSPTYGEKSTSNSLLESIATLSQNSKLPRGHSGQDESRRPAVPPSSVGSSPHRSRKWKSIMSPVNGKFTLNTLRIFSPSNFTALAQESRGLTQARPISGARPNPFITIRVM